MKGLILRFLIVVLILWAIVLPSTTMASMARQDTQIQASTTVATSGPEANLPYLFAAYTITWIAFFTYLYYLSQRQQNLRREIEDLRLALSENKRQSNNS